MSYGESNSWIEWGKYLVFRLGNIFGFTQALVAGIFGCALFFISWMYLPNAYRLLLAIPVIKAFLRDQSISVSTLVWTNWGLVVFITFLGIACWCRVAVLTNPTVFDRYKIKGVPL